MFLNHCHLSAPEFHRSCVPSSSWRKDQSLLTLDQQTWECRSCSSALKAQGLKLPL